MNIPSLQGNWVDFAILLFLIFYIWEGWGKEFILLFLELVVFLLSFIIALKLYPFMGNLLVDYFAFPQGLARAIGFFLIGVVAEQILSQFSGMVVSRIPPKVHKHTLNKLLSFIPLLGNAFILLTFVLILALSLPIQSFIKRGISESTISKPLIQQTQAVEKQLSGIFGQALSDSLNFITISPLADPNERVKLNFRQQELTVDEGSETEMLSRVNKERRDRGLKELVVDEKLRELARVYARDMFERGYFSHYNLEGESPFDRMSNADISYLVAGENLALAPNVGIAHQGLMDSPGHRENILNPDFGHVGIGVVDGGVYGKMFVQEFTD